MFTLTISNEQPSIYVPGRTRTIQNTETAPVFVKFNSDLNDGVSVVNTTCRFG